MRTKILSLACLLSTLFGTARAQQTDTLSIRQQDIIAIAAYTGVGDLTNLKTVLAKGLDHGMTVNEVKEVLVHAYAYCGFPRSLRALQTFIAVLEERKSQGISDVIGKDASPVTDTRDKFTRGAEILSKLNGIPADAPKADYAEFAPIIEQFLKEHLFCDIFERDVLTYKERELATVSILAAMGGVEPMARGHMGICLHQGITPAQLYGLLDIIERNIGKAQADSVRQVLDEMTNDNSKNNTKMSTKVKIEDPFERGSLMADNPNFTGNAWLQGYVAPQDGFGCTVANVTFAAGCRNSWHSHKGGQLLLCTSGKGYYQEKGKPIRLLLPGDVVKIAPDVIHWHGAAPDSEFSHLAIGTQLDKGGVTWLEPVTDEEYNSYNP